MKHVTTQAEVWCYFLSSPITLLPMRAQHSVAAYNTSLALIMRSTGAEIAGIQKIFSNSSCKWANSFYLTRRQRVLWFLHRDSRASIIVVIILCLQNAESSKISTNLVSWSSMTRTFLRDNNAVFRNLAIIPGIALRDIWRNVFSRPYLIRSRLWYSEHCVCLSVVVCTECNVAKWCVVEQKLLLTAYRKSYMIKWLVPKWMTFV